MRLCVLCFYMCVGRDGGSVFEGKSRWLCVWLHLGADDSLGGSLNVGRQTKECRSVILGEILYYAAVVLGSKQRHTQVTHTLCHGGDATQYFSISKQHMQLYWMDRTIIVLVIYMCTIMLLLLVIVWLRLCSGQTNSSRTPTNMEQVFGRLIWGGKKRVPPLLFLWPADMEDERSCAEKNCSR